MLSVFYIILYTTPTILLALIQIKHIKNNNKAVILNNNDFKIAKDYAIIMQNHKILESILSTILFVFWTNFALSSILIGDSFIDQVFSILLFLVINILLSMPLNTYKTLVIDKAFGFSKITLKLYVIDYIKMFLLLIIFGGLIITALIYMISNFSLWWLYGFILLFLISLIINIIYPTIIAPLFNKFTPLNDKNLEEKINKIMHKVGFNTNGIFIMDASKRDGRLNAYFGGLSKNKRVVLFDTLLNKISQNELLAILGHELAHFKHKDLIKNLFISAVVLFILFFIALQIHIHIGNIKSLNMIAQLPYTTICMLILISPVITFYFLPFINYFSRKAEYNADKFGSSLTNREDLCNALIKLVNENKTFPYSHSLNTFFYLSHPPLLDRLKALNYDIK